MKHETMRQILLIFFLLAFTWAAAGQNSEKQPTGFDPAPWLDDFYQLLSEMSAHYANLEWAIEERKMELPQLRAQTEANLREAKDEADARRVFSKFIDRFGDGHLEIRWPKAREQSSYASQDTPGNLCTRLGYKAGLSPGLNFSVLPSFAYLNTEEAKLYPGGLLNLGAGRIVGVLRVALFSEHAFPEICEQAARMLNVAENSTCDATCSDVIELETANLATAALVKRANRLRQAGATALLVDITRNGGGSNWVEAPPRALSAVPLRDPQFAFIKHEHWTKQLQERLANIQTDIRKGAGPRPVLEDAARKMQKASEESKRSCTRAGVWETGKLNCSLLVKNVLYTSGVLGYAKPGSFASLESRTVLFHPIRYSYTEDRNRLPLYVVVDRNTWSAAEYFAAILQDNHAATILGELTGGAGCGYTEGGIPTTLKNSGAEVKMPDCVRLRADGSDEVNGITPDVLVPWAERDSEYQRVNKLVVAVQKTMNSNSR
jgi:peptidase S41-like protein